MISIGTFAIVSFAFSDVSLALLRPPTLSNPSVKPRQELPQLLAVVNPYNPFAPEEVDLENIPCRNEPVGLGIPGFQPGVPKSAVIKMFGAPKYKLPGYWPNTNAFSYELIPDEVSLGFLFDRDSQLLRQTEASFAQSVSTEIILGTLNSMLGCQLNPEITQGFQQVWLGETPSYSFSLDHLNGIIHWEERDVLSGVPPPHPRVYIGIWEKGLHR
ncbi:hypothetical protein [Phormidium sp. CCY1219]|uniref:hypothetical protein n=1 Tax=Phormidium sp. CCY1219 TaxID=2886104 RepID=UPI002D1E7E2C|nr:hypothetical protein [Phormidium sp. CCY1219]MEB3827468.1 hypothetical protein [Phormidium sp. CCY1219]